MEHRPFGRTGLDVSAIGFGCWEVGGGYGQVDEAEFGRAVGRALDLGINCFDTAEGYGMGASERALGQALGSRRDEAIVVTKFGMNYRDKPNLRDSSRERVMASIDKSLKNLGTDYVDVYIVHWPDRQTPVRGDDERARRRRPRRARCASSASRTSSATRSRRAWHVRRVDVVQYGWNMFDRRMQREIFPYCEEHGVGLHGVRVARVRTADRHLHRGHGLR